ncbi:MAG: lytic transglycosylase domain-containing protein [Blastocatellia bacterium]
MINRAITASIMILTFALTAAAQDAATLQRAKLYEPLMSEAGKRHGVDPRLIWTVAYLESRFQPREISPKGAHGLMQLMPATAARFGVKNIFDPAQSIQAAARYLRFLLDLFDGNVSLALAGYNAGEGTVLAFREGRQLTLSDGRTINPKGIRTGGVPPYRETRGYVKNGLALYLKLAAAASDVSLKTVKRRLQIVEAESEDDGEELPPEIVELKQGSIYVVEDASQPDRPARSRHSIYPRH